MSSLIFAFNCVAPLFLMVAVGSLLRHRGWIKAEHMPLLNKLCFNLLLPCMLFKSALTADYHLVETPLLYVYMAATFILTALLLCLTVPKYLKDPKQAGAFIHSSFRPNAVIVGVPLAINMLGADGAFPVVLMAMVLAPLFNVLGVIVLTIFSREGKRINILQLLKDVVTNPLIIGVVLGMLGAWIGLELPNFLLEPIESFGTAATPIAMLVIGARFEFKGMARDLRLICASTLIKLVIMPVIFMIPPILLGIRGGELAAVYVVHAVPSASTGGVVTEIMGCDGTLANEIVLFSTAASIFTLFLGLLILKQFSLI